jgi:alpha-galactosidase
VNGGVAQELDLNGDTFNDPTPVVIAVNLRAGANTIEFGNPTGYAPDLDRIVVAPEIKTKGAAQP